MSNLSTPEKRIRFDGTINLGHIITFAGFIFTAVIAWNAMDKRVVVLEEARLTQVVTDRRQDEEIVSTRREQRETLKDVSGKLDRLIERGWYLK